MTVDQATPAEWLASAAADPERVLAWWQADPEHSATLPAGIRFDAIMMPLAAAEQLVAVLRASGAPGPVYLDRPGHVGYALVPPGTAESWTVPGTSALGVATWLWVPDPGATGETGVSWACPPDGSGALCSPDDVLSVLAAA